MCGQQWQIHIAYTTHGNGITGYKHNMAPLYTQRHSTK